MGVLPLDSIRRYTPIPSDFPGFCPISNFFAKGLEYWSIPRVSSPTGAQLQERPPAIARPKRAMRALEKVKGCTLTRRP